MRGYMVNNHLYNTTYFLVCERVAYTRIDEIVSIKDVIENTITGIKGVGGLQTRGKYREGYPKSLYLN